MMWSKRNRLAVAMCVFEELFWIDEETTTRHEFFEESNMEEVVAGDNEDVIDQLTIKKAIVEYRLKGEKYYQSIFLEFMDDWKKTMNTVKCVLYTWVLESDLTGIDKSELIGKYIKLTQDLVAGGNTGLVHALLSKVSGTYHESEKTADLPPK